MTCDEFGTIVEDYVNAPKKFDELGQMWTLMNNDWVQVTSHVQELPELPKKFICVYNLQPTEEEIAISERAWKEELAAANDSLYKVNDTMKDLSDVLDGFLEQVKAKRQVHYIDTGDMSEEQAAEHVNQAMKKIKAKSLSTRWRDLAKDN